MTDDKAEHRGWEPNAEFTPHILDDPDYDLAQEEMESGSPMAWVLGLVAGFLIGGCFLLGKWLEPPKIVFAAPGLPSVNNVIAQQIVLKDGKSCPMLNLRGASMSCLYVNGKEKVIRPNYENPACQKEFMARIKK